MLSWSSLPSQTGIPVHHPITLSCYREIPSLVAGVVPLQEEQACIINYSVGICIFTYVDVINLLFDCQDNIKLL